jgi:hypothetical protein
MELQTIWIFYYLICLALAVAMVKETKDRSYRGIGLIFVLTFLLLVVNYFGFPALGSYYAISMTFGYLFFFVMVVRNNISNHDRVVLMIIPTLTFLLLYHRALHLVGTDEMRLLTAALFMMTLIYGFTLIYIRKTLSLRKESIETNGMFASILLPSLVS